MFNVRVLKVVSVASTSSAGLLTRTSVTAKLLLVEVELAGNDVYILVPVVLVKDDGFSIESSPLKASLSKAIIDRIPLKRMAAIKLFPLHLLKI